MPLNTRLGNIVNAHIGNSAGITPAEKAELSILKEEFPPLLARLRQIAEKEIPAIEALLNQLNAPWTPGRIPEYPK